MNSQDQCPERQSHSDITRGCGREKVTSLGDCSSPSSSRMGPKFILKPTHGGQWPHTGSVAFDCLGSLPLPFTKVPVDALLRPCSTSEIWGEPRPVTLFSAVPRGRLCVWHNLPGAQPKMGRPGTLAGSQFQKIPHPSTLPDTMMLKKKS